MASTGASPILTIRRIHCLYLPRALALQVRRQVLCHHNREPIPVEVLFLLEPVLQARVIAKPRVLDLKRNQLLVVF